MRRDLLLQQLAAAGAGDDLLRAIHVLYSDTRACIRSADGYGSLFDIFLGTREGGVESPILYSLFVFDLVAKLSTVELDSSLLKKSIRPVPGIRDLVELEDGQSGNHDAHLEDSLLTQHLVDFAQ